MRPVLWKEIREIAPGGAPYVLLAALFCVMLGIKNESAAAAPSTLAAAALGALLGLSHGARDRAHRSEPFLVHRAADPLRFHLVRTFAGAAVVVALHAAFLAMILFFPYRRGIKVLGFLWDQHPTGPTWRDLSPGALGFSAVVALTFWAVARLGMVRTRTVAGGTAVALGFVAVLTLATLRSGGAGAWWAVLVILVVAVACTLVELTAGPARARPTGGLRCALWTAVVLAVCMESLLWMRTVAAIPVLEELHRAGFDAEGRLGVGSAQRGLVRVANPALAESPVGTSERWVEGRDDASWRGAPAIRVMCAWLSSGALPSLGVAGPGPWTFEDGRFVRRDAATGAVVATLGPDGSVAGSPPPGAARWDATDLVIPTYPWQLTETLEDGTQKYVTGRLIADQSTGTVTLVSNAMDRSRQSAGPLAGNRELDVRTFAPHAPEGRPVRLHVGGQRWGGLVESGFQGSGLEGLLIPFDAGGDLVVMDGAGRERVRIPDAGRARRTMIPTYSRVGAADFEFVLVAESLRVDRVTLDGWASDAEGNLVRSQVVLLPRESEGVTAALLAGVPSLLHSPALNVVSALGPEPANFEELFGRFWLHPHVTGLAGIPWLVGSIVVGLLCALRARRVARVQGATRTEVRRWFLVAAVLGPVALILQRLFLRRSHAEPCLSCRKPRPVHLDTCESCGTPWPPPEPTGIELIVDGAEIAK